MDKQIVKAPKLASGVAKRGIIGKTVTMNTQGWIQGDPLFFATQKFMYEETLRKLLNEK
jgi:hypothetical protein